MYLILFLLAVLSSMLSQLPSMLESGMDTYLKLTWLLPGAWGILKYPNCIFTNKLIPFLIFLGVFSMYCLLMESISGKMYTQGDLYNIAVAFVITVVSYTFWKIKGSEKVLIIISIGIFIVTIYLGFAIYYNFLVGYDITSRIYAYQSKNSMAQILLAGMMVGLFCAMPRYKKYMYLWIGGALFLTVVIFLLKSRATLIGLFFVCAYMMIKYPNKKIRRIALAVGILIVIYFCYNQSLFYSIVDNFIYAGRDANDIDDVTSGRLTIAAGKLSNMEGNIIFGVGHNYLDCMPIAIFIQYGIVGWLIYLLFFIWMSKVVIINNKDDGMLGLSTFLLFSIYMINSLFEAYPPFGPGAKCFILWMFFGFYIALSDKKKNTLKMLNNQSNNNNRKKFKYET